MMMMIILEWHSTENRANQSDFDVKINVLEREKISVEIQTDIPNLG